MIRVRVGIHTGTPLVGEEGYVGHDVHRAARIAAAGHGGGSVSAKPSPIVGRWQMIRTCQNVVGALQAAGLRPLAPAAVGE